MQRFMFNLLIKKIPLEEEMASHSSIFAWTIPWAEELDELLSMRLQSQTWLSDWAHTHKYNSLKLKIKRSSTPTSDMAVWVASQIRFSKTTCNSWIFIEMTDEAETPILWPPDMKSWLIEKDPDAGKAWRQEKKGGNRGLNVWLASPTQWRWVWANCEGWCRTGKHSMLQGQGVRHDWTATNNNGWIVSSPNTC